MSRSRLLGARHSRQQSAAQTRSRMSSLASQQSTSVPSRGRQSSRIAQQRRRALTLLQQHGAHPGLQRRRSARAPPGAQGTEVGPITPRVRSPHPPRSMTAVLIVIITVTRPRSEWRKAELSVVGVRLQACGCVGVRVASASLHRLCHLPLAVPLHQHRDPQPGHRDQRNSPRRGAGQQPHNLCLAHHHNRTQKSYAGQT